MNGWHRVWDADLVSPLYYGRKQVAQDLEGGCAFAVGVQPMPTDIAKYSIELFKSGGEGARIEEILDRHADLKVSRSIYRASVEKFPGRLIMLCDGAQVLARSDRPETMPR
jgi:hypothetical protein